jgi:hypothetical protein
VEVPAHFGQEREKYGLASFCREIRKRLMHREL